MAADQAHEWEPAVADLSREVRELDPAFAPDPLDRMVLLAEYPVYRLGAANQNPLLFVIALSCNDSIPV